MVNFSLNPLPPSRSLAWEMARTLQTYPAGESRSQDEAAGQPTGRIAQRQGYFGAIRLRRFLEIDPESGSTAPPQELKSLMLSESVANLSWPLMIDAEQVLVQLSTESRVGQSSAPDVTAARVATSLIRVEARPTRLPQLGTLDGSGG